MCKKRFNGDSKNLMIVVASTERRAKNKKLQV